MFKVGDRVCFNGEIFEVCELWDDGRWIGTRTRHGVYTELKADECTPVEIVEDALGTVMIVLPREDNDHTSADAERAGTDAAPECDGSAEDLRRSDD